jgi:phage terminase large subunit GpA-like protein
MLSQTLARRISTFRKQALTKAVTLLMQLWRPPPDLTISEWAEEKMWLSREDSNEAGKYHIDRAEYQREPLDTIGHPLTRRVTMIWASQLGKTLLMKTVLEGSRALRPGLVLGASRAPLLKGIQ